METKNRLYGADRPDRFKTFSRRLGRSERSGRSNANQALQLLQYGSILSFGTFAHNKLSSCFGFWFI